MKIDSSVIKQIMYEVDPDAESDVEFVSNINMLILLMEQRQREINKKKKK